MILVDIYVPVVDETYDFMIDENADPHKVISEISEMIAKKTHSRESRAEDLMLYDTKSMKPLPLDRSVYESGVRDGSRLILV